MKEAAFRELLKSVKQAGRIRRGELRPSRVTTFLPEDVKAVRARLAQTQEEFALMIGVRAATLESGGKGGPHRGAPPFPLLGFTAGTQKCAAAALHRHFGGSWQ